MKILVISDSHGRRTTLEDVVRLCESPNAPDMVILWATIIRMQSTSGSA